MTVYELREALLHVDQGRKVYLVFAKEDERPATCILASRYGILVCDTDEEISVSERIIFNENETAE